MKQLRSLDKTVKRLGNEIVIFYISELVLSEIDNFSQALYSEGQELTVQGQSALNALRVRASRRISRIFKWIKEYLVFAIDSELDNQHTLSPNGSVRIPELICAKEFNSTSRVDKFLIHMSESEIRSFLKKAISRFKQKCWSAGFGGAKWAKIAQVALEMWSTDSLKGKCVLIDRTFQIEHNGGMIFDKRPSRVVPDELRDRQILTIKKRARDLDDLLKKLKPKTTDKRTKILISTLVDSLRMLKKSKRRNSLGGD